jgi:hypothetical protein
MTAGELVAVAIAVVSVLYSDSGGGVRGKGIVGYSVARGKVLASPVGENPDPRAGVHRQRGFLRYSRRPYSSCIASVLTGQNLRRASAYRGVLGASCASTRKPRR